MKALTLILMSLPLIGCAAKSTRTQVLQSMAAGAALGALYGATRPEMKSANAQMYAGLGAGVGALYAVSRMESDSSGDTLRAENQRLRAELDRISEPRTEVSSSAFFGAKVPAKYRGLVNPGEWRVVRVDRWVEGASENQLVHEDLVMELAPPSLKMPH